MITFGDCSKESSKETEKWLDPQLWHACAGGMVQMPAVNSKVYYFPQGHAEHAQGSADFGNCMIPALILCMVAGVKFLADPETDEVYAKMELVPTRKNDYGEQQDEVLVSNHHGSGSNNASEKPVSFSKTLTQSDANNGGGFSVPRYCAETIFPPLDYTADPPVQTVVAKDVLGNVWSFRHIYRGTPRRHLLTTGWSTFVNQKKLVAGDSIVFMRTDKGGDLCVGIRRAKRGGAANGGPESPSPSGWNPAAGTSVGLSPYGGMFSIFLREDDTKLLRNGNSISGGGLKGGTGTGTGRVRPESVTEAATLAANGHPFEVVYYPRASTPEFCVKAASVRAAMRIHWCSGLRFKMPFETEDSSRISWFMGTISSVQVADPVHWPNSPWRLLQVAWDEPDLLQNVKRVSPWLVELVSNMPIHLTPFSPPRKKLRLPSHHDFLLDSQLPMPTFSGNPLGSSSPLCCPSDNTPASIQGARHVQYGISLTDLHLNKLQSGLFPASFQRLDRTAPPSRVSTSLIVGSPNVRENVSCLLTMGNSSQNVNKPDDGKRTHFVLFGQPILTEQQISRSCYGDAVSSVLTRDSSSYGHPDKPANLLSNGPQGNLSSEGFPWYKGQRASELGLETSHCKVFMESEDVGRTLDLSVLGSYEELYGRLANMFGIERSGMLSQVLYRDAKGTVKQTGDEPFSEFMKTARRLTILMDSGSDNIGRQIQPIHVSV